MELIVGANPLLNLTAFSFHTPLPHDCLSGHFCQFVSMLYPSQQFFSHVGMFPRFNQYQAEDKVSCSVKLEPAT